MVDSATDLVLTNQQPKRVAHGPWSDLALHTIGWRAFQDLCSQVCEVVLGRPVEIFREAQDGGQDAVFLIPAKDVERDAIGSVQCKHSSEPGKTLRLSDLTPELDHVRELVRLGQADTYVFMTNMGVNAPTAIEIRQKLRSMGVRKAHVLGKQYIVRTIRSSPRLRALVPQIYGLGDLTSILDERLSQQSRALLDHWIPKLKAYVPTCAHRSAVKALSEHGIVLLLGNPSSGKSAIGAILSTIASEDPNHTVLALTSPRDFEAGWNPNDPGRFFWIDDAFGPNVLREDYVQDWSSAFRKVQAAISKGNRFLLTSRKHIYEAAKRRLGQRNLSVFIDGSALVDVTELLPEEKSQILYNHINYGTQSQSWKAGVKPHLQTVAAAPGFLPGIAERLGNPTFTKSLAIRREALVRFMSEPREHLIDTINALDEVSQAALQLVYVHQGAFDSGAPDQAAAQAVTDLTGITLPRILDSFSDLKGSFLRGPASGDRVWSFAHPTIADALTEILRGKPHMMEALLRGATIDTILSSFVCEGSASIRDALTLPATLNALLVTRLLNTPDEIGRTWSLFWFLAFRASDAVFRSVVQADPTMLERSSWSGSTIKYDPRINVHARAHSAGLLNDLLREVSASKLEEAAQINFDLSYFDNPEIMNLIPPMRLVSLGIKLRTCSLLNTEERISDLADEADLDAEPDSHFDVISSALQTLEGLTDDEEAVHLISSARQRISDEIERLAERKRERENEDEDDVDWTQISTVSQRKDQIGTPFDNINVRSIFDDVDQ
ncbi:hypothetical protein F1643_14300 [Azospirillum sp. INR13]|uniref:nSTAND3 domain-containing NTPase n=1 Tax=Azospirillum sp. INR13 TaxID=2596919 RepID=UPI001892552D|nr:hypothetical protein [Azospirillum sp. INR13]MBF5095423.1 hypothetical protein [Azospirillum sp. INR13]